LEIPWTSVRLANENRFVINQCKISVKILLRIFLRSILLVSYYSRFFYY